MDTYGRLLYTNPNKSQTGNTLLSNQYTLRRCNESYRFITGINSISDTPPERDGLNQPGKIPPMKSIQPLIGHWINGSTIVFNPFHFDSIQEWKDQICSNIKISIKSKRLWDIDNTVNISDASVDISSMSDAFIRVYDSQKTNPYAPLCAYTAMAYLESSTKRGKNSSLYPLPGISSISTTSFGGAHNNTSIEITFEEKKGTRNMSAREYNDSWDGFICQGYTAHSADAGKTRRVTCYTRLRIVNEDSFSVFDNILDGDSNKNWILYCMGYTTDVTYNAVVEIVNAIDNYSKQYANSQFNNTLNNFMSGPLTYAIYERERVLYISMTQGVILKLLEDGCMVDSHAIHNQKDNSISKRRSLPDLDMKDNKCINIEYHYSLFWLLAPFGVCDRPPRGLFAAAQTPQAVGLPWSVGTAVVSPTHVSKSLVSTQFVLDMHRDHEINEDAIWDIIPGECVTICYMNMPDNFDDSIILSSRFADNGGFSSVSMLTYRVKENEIIPDVGETLCRKIHKWWKMPCTNTCRCASRKYSSCNISVGRVPTGKIHSVERTEDGMLSIRVLSYSQILTGDKLSTMHGQKGVAIITPYENLPQIVLEDGSTIIADVYMAVGTITSRETIGQMYESGKAWRAARDGNKYITDDYLDLEFIESQYVYSGITGDIIYRQLTSGKVEPIKVSIGMTRIISQTQMTRERHHLTHGIEAKYSTGTTQGRGGGGGVRTAEMDFHALIASGRFQCAQEILDRGAMVRVPVCKRCKKSRTFHECGLDDEIVYVRMLYNVWEFDNMSAAINGSSNTYTIEHI